MSSKPERRRTLIDLIKEMRRERKTLYGVARQQYSGVATTAAAPANDSGGGSGVSPPVPQTNFLNTAGGYMLGPIGLYPKIVVISGGVLDLTPDSGDSSARVIVTGEGLVDDELDSIYTAGVSALIGQQIQIESNLGTEITITENDNILVDGVGGTFVLEKGYSINLVFSSGNVPPKWKIVRAPDVGAAGSGASKTLDNLTSPTAVNQSLIPSGAFDLGTSGNKWVNGFFSGTISTDGLTTTGDVILGNTGGDLVTFNAEVGSNILPDLDVAFDLGSSTKAWQNIFCDSLFLNSSLDQFFGADSGGINYKVPTSDTHDFQVNNVVIFSVTGTDCRVDGGKPIKSAGAVEICFQVTSDNITVGAEGSVQLPYKSGTASTAAQADTDFGNGVGCIGLYTDTTGNVQTLCIRQDDGNWATTTMTNDGLT